MNFSFCLCEVGMKRLFWDKLKEYLYDQACWLANPALYRCQQFHNRCYRRDNGEQGQVKAPSFDRHPSHSSISCQMKYTLTPSTHPYMSLYTQPFIDQLPVTFRILWGWGQPVKRNGKIVTKAPGSSQCHSPCPFSSHKETCPISWVWGLSSSLFWIGDY